MSFLENYLKFTHTQEATDRVHTWVALSIVAAALERKVWLNRAHYTLYPNLYTAIVGPSGIVRKSTSSAIGIDLLNNLNSVNMMSESMTSASLITQLVDANSEFEYKGKHIKQAAVFAYASEFHIMLKENFGSVIELLTTFYDCQPNDSRIPWRHVTVGDGERCVYGPCLNILGASTPAWLVKSIPANEMEGGFASRIIFVMEDQAKRAIAWPDLEGTPEDTESKKRFLVAELKRIHEMRGFFITTPEVREQGQKWYESHQRFLRANTDQRFAGYYGRKFDTILKVCMILSAAESSSLEIRLPHFEQALALLQDIEGRMFEAFSSHGENPDAKPIEKIWRFLCEKGKASLSEITSFMRKDANHDSVQRMLFSLEIMRRAIRHKDDIKKDIFYTPVDPDRPL